MIAALAECQLPEIEIGAFVNPRVMPPLAGSDEVAKGLPKIPGVTYRGVYFTASGAERALGTGTLDVEGMVSVAPSSTFMKRVANRTTAEVLGALPDYVGELQHLGLTVDSVGVIAAFGCNFEGDMDVNKVLDLIAETTAVLEEQGESVREVTLADTMGWATPDRVQALVGAFRMRWPDRAVRLHLHDTRGLGLANAYAGLALGVRHFDSSVAGIGGCPFTKGAGAAGNIATEDFVHMCQEMGIGTGIDLERLVEATPDILALLSVKPGGKVAVAGSLESLRSSLTSPPLV